MKSHRNTQRAPKNITKSCFPIDKLVYPVYDVLYRYLDDSNIPIPSHYYVIALRCDSASCDDDMTYTTQAFVIPHTPNITNCMVRASKGIIYSVWQNL